MEHAEDAHAAEHHVVPYATFVVVWVVLLALTGLLVGLSLISHKAAVAGMLTVTPLKAGLVFYFFMHLKYERLLFKIMLLVAMCTLLIFFALLFVDILFR